MTDPDASPRIRVVYLDHTAKLSGGELALARLLDAVSSGVDATVVIAEEGELASLLRERGVRVVILALSPATAAVSRNDVRGRASTIVAIADMLGYTIRTARLLQRLKPQLVHTNSIKSGLYGSVAARLVRIPVIWHVRDRIAPDYMPVATAAFLRMLIDWLPDAVVCNSATTMACLGARATRRGSVLHDPYYPGGSANTSDACSPMTIAMIGRLAPWKGQHVAIAAFAKAFPDGTEVLRVVGSAMFGEDAYADHLKKLARALAVSDRVDFVGFAMDVESHLRKASMLVHASTIPEPFGQVVVEGLAAGVPVIASNSGGPAEILQDGVNGLLVQPGDVDALAAAMTALASSGALRRQLADSGLRRAKDFTPSRIAPQALALYDSVLSRTAH